MEELESSLPVAMLFLKNLSKIEIRHDGRQLRIFEKVMDDDRLIISHGDSADDRVWHLLRGSFEDSASDLRLRHPGRIEDKRSAEVVIALPADEELRAGLLCACLPTEEGPDPGLPFHVNADFFPSNDRKNVILGDDYQSQWNQEALFEAARTVAKATPQLTRLLGAERFWHLASALYALFNAHKDSRNSIWAEFWSALEDALRKEAVVLTSSGDWTTANSGVAVLLQREEEPNIPVLEGLGIKLVAEGLRPYQAMLRSVGVPVFDIDTLCSALTSSGLDRPVAFDDLPLCITSGSGRTALWTEIDILLGRQGRTPYAKLEDEERLRAVSLAPSHNKFLWPCRDVYVSDATTVQLFSSLGLDIPFLDQAEMSFAPLRGLCDAFEAEDAVQSLEESDPVAIQRLWTEGRYPLPKLIAWFENRRGQIVDDEDICRRLAALPIYPSADRLHPLNSLVLPGGFNDPLGLTNIVDIDTLGGRRDFLISIGVAKLDFRTYVLEHLPKALDSYKLHSTVKQQAVILLADHLGELMGDDEVRETLSLVPLVICADREYHHADDCYFPNDTVQEVLGNNVNIAVLPKEREAAVQELLTWLGVEREPRVNDIMQTIHRISNEPCSDTSVEQIQKIVIHLGRRFEDIVNDIGIVDLFLN